MERLSQQTYAEMAIDWARRNVIATTVVGLLGVTVPLGIYFYGSRYEQIQEKEISTQEDETAETSEPSKRSLPRISIFSIHVSEVAMDIPAAFELGIQAGGITNLAVHDIDVVLDFGRAEIDVCDYTPEAAVTNVLSEDKSHRRIEIKELQQEEKFYIRCLITSPVFNQVIINAGNIDRSVSMDFEQYQARHRREEDGFWSKLFQVFAACMVGIFCLWVVKKVFSD